MTPLHKLTRRHRQAVRRATEHLQCAQEFEAKANRAWVGGFDGEQEQHRIAADRQLLEMSAAVWECQCAQQWFPFPVVMALDEVPLARARLRKRGWEV